MGCNCGKVRTSKQFVWTSPTGQTKVYATEIEAKAAVVRQGGTYAVK